MNKAKRPRLIAVFYSALVSILLVNSAAYPAAPPSARDKIKVFVSILPQAYFVERVGGRMVDVSVMVGPGHSPHTYEPTPRQMAEIGKARIYFTIGVLFETVWIKRLSSSNPDMKVIDMSQGIELRPMQGVHDHGDEVGRHDEGALKDPHTWLSLRLAKVHAQNIASGLISEDPEQRAYYEENLKRFHQDLDRLDSEITQMFVGATSRRFMVFHPAWGYFAADYGLEQIPVEIGGKDPTARTLAMIVDRAKEEGIKVVFVQAQFSTRNADTIARAIGGRTIQIDPLARDYPANMKKIAEILREAMP